jgi:hypothetical protein
VLAAVAAPAHARVDWQGWGRPLTPLGWSADGVYFAFTKQVEYFPLETIDDPDAPELVLVFGVVIDARIGREQAYVLSLTDARGRAVARDEFASSPKRPAWDAWLAAHPLVVTRGPEGPGGVSAHVRAASAGTPIDASWADGRFRFAAPAGPPAEVVLEVVRDGRTWRSLATGDGSNGFVGEAEPFWSADGRRVAWWLLEREEDRSTGYVVVAPVGPRVELVVSPGIDAATIAHGQAWLAAAGLAPSALATTVAPIATTIVQAEPVAERDVRAVAWPGKPPAFEPLAAPNPAELDVRVLAGPELLGAPTTGRVNLGELDHERTWRGLAIAVAIALAAWLLARLPRRSAPSGRPLG